MAEQRTLNRSGRVGPTGYTGPDQLVLGEEPTSEGPSGQQLAGIVAANVAKRPTRSMSPSRAPSPRMTYQSVVLLTEQLRP